MSKIVSTGSYLPANIVTNTELVEQASIDSSDEWISQRTGIKQRHFASEDESLAQIAGKAAEKALEKYGRDVRDEINLIVLATMSSHNPTPAVASQVQAILGVKETWAFDISGACAGFVMAAEVAEKISRDYTSGYTLVIGAEKMSSILDFNDRSTAILFGDGAGAVLIQNDGEGLPDYRSELKSIPDEKDSIVVDPDSDESDKMAMSGRDVFNFVVREIIPSLSRFIEKEASDFDYLLSHQANERLVDIMVDKLKIDAEKAPVNIDRTANTSAASIPILWDELVRDGTLKLNGEQKIVLTGFGGGLSWGHITFDV